jgi:hypothetical protein
VGGVSQCIYGALRKKRVDEPKVNIQDRATLTISRTERPTSWEMRGYANSKNKVCSFDLISISTQSLSTESPTLVSKPICGVYMSWECRDPVIVTNMFNDLARNTASIHRLNALRLHARTANVALFVHDLLERIVFPAEDVITMVTVSGVISERVDERLAAVFRPHGRIIERCGFVNHFVHDLRYAYGMGGGTRALGFECA